MPLTLIPLPSPQTTITPQPGKKNGTVHYLTSLSTAAIFLGPASDSTPETLRKAGGHLANWLLDNEIETAIADLAELEALEISGGREAFLQGFLLGAFRFDQHKTSPAQTAPTLQLKTASAHEPLVDEMARAAILAEAQNLTRTWAHEPPNVINPVTLAERVQTLAAEEGLACKVLTDSELTAMGAHALVSVGQASKTPSRLIILEYPGDGTADTAPVAVVGKAITFDTGGYTIKSRAGMVGMKYDKCGGMAVAGIMQAAARLKLKTPLVGVIAAAENMISGYAYRPNDIITTLSGKTVEIISADAEGRMVLADALTYTEQEYQPQSILDLATLTGGVGVALGGVRAGIMANNQPLADALLAAGERTHERLWQLPLDDEYLELIQGDDSDFKNSAGAPRASAIVGGMFLKQFTSGETPWAHVDIASTATLSKAGAYCPKGATGFGVRLVVDYLESLG